ncbi:MAG: hypothetical protein JSR46_04105 [Verrucomicrobia bacterium]|nr:hypothetical protein [Verrucomicrobiota bacterium]
MSLPLYSVEFAATKKQLRLHYKDKKVVMIASPGRSGSTLLTDCIERASGKYKVVKTHLLPPNKKYRGKILFIFSNPDKAAESALHMTLHDAGFAAEHFFHMGTAKRKWVKQINKGFQQTKGRNLLACDALGCYPHLKKWLYTRTKASTPKKAQILAIKYEDLWKGSTIRAIRKFLRLRAFSLPPQKRRGYSGEDLLPQERLFREAYNVGSSEQPIYSAYDKARRIWKDAPPYQFLKIK